MDEKKPSTADILAKIRAQKAAAAAAAPADTPDAPAAESVPAPAESPADVASTAEAASTPPQTAAAQVTPGQSPAATGAKPTGTKDILAAIRAQGGKGAAKAAPAAATPAAAAKPAAAKAPAAGAPAASGPLPSVADMVRAARKGAPAVEAAEAAKVAAAPPVMPAKPVPAKAKAGAKSQAPDGTRRSLSAVIAVTFVSLSCIVLSAVLGSPLLFTAGLLVWGLVLSAFGAAWASIAAVTGIATLGTARFMFPNVLVEPPSRFKVGPVSDYPLNTVSNKWKDQFGIWIVHTDQYEGQNLIFALSTVCTHLGCTPNWLDGEQKFKCPCHGSGFYITGVNFEGPAPRPLERVGLRIAEDGLLEVDKGLKFQEEMGQWTDPASFVSPA